MPMTMTGDATFLKGIRPKENSETGADRLRRLFRDTGDWKALVNDMTQRWGQELQAAEEVACVN